VKIDGQLRSIQLAHPDKKEDSKQFTFDDVFGPECAQSQLYEKTAYSLVDAVLHGYNGILLKHDDLIVKEHYLRMDKVVPVRHSLCWVLAI
jgi:hypothetical protein